MTQCTIESFRENYPLMLYGLVVVLCAIAASYLLSYLFVRKRNASSAEDYQRNIYRYALTFGNYGYLGMNTIVYPAAYGGDTQTGASMTSISHALAVITLPIMYLVFIVMM